MPRSFLSRGSRARVLAERRPEAREALSFYAEIAAFQHEVDPGAPLASLPRLVALVAAQGPGPLRAAREIDEKTAGAPSRTRRRPEFLRPGAVPGGERAPEAPIRAGVPLRASAAGGCLPQETEPRFPACSLCFHEWPAARDRCSGCGGEVAFHETSELPQIRVRTCESCRRYLHVVRLDVEPEAIPEVDEMAALSLDVWARERGYEKIFPNLVGI
jgi:formate dehydrogenase maturation protein FdhE